MNEYVRLILVIGVCGVCTMLTRALPFMVFGGNRQVPKVVLYLGKVLPPTIIATLVIFCLRNVDFMTGNHGVCELIGILTAGVLHFAFGNSFVSIGTATILYMILIRLV